MPGGLILAVFLVCFLTATGWAAIDAARAMVREALADLANGPAPDFAEWETELSEADR